MAYVVGYFAADGSMLCNRRGAHFIEFYGTDKELIVLVRDLLKSNHKISIRNRNPLEKTGYRLQLGSKELYTDLFKLGMTPAKSKTLTLPKIPSTVFAHFLRGYFDGDGCVYFKKHFAKDRQKKRWVFTVRFTSGSYTFLSDLLSSLKKKTVNGGFITSKKGGHELVFSHRDGLALFHLMYDNTSHRSYLSRKYKLFKKAIQTLYGGVA